MKNLNTAAGVFLTHFLLVALVIVMTSCPNPAEPEPDEGFSKLLASDGTSSDEFGHSVFISGDYAIVGAMFADGVASGTGAAYIFLRSGASWTQQAKLTADDGANIDYFGMSVCLSGDYAIVGAGNDDDKGFNSGSAYIFVRGGASWTQQAKLTADDGAAADCFGCSVGISGDYAIVGAYGDDDNGSDSGSAYIFGLSGAVWSPAGQAHRQRWRRP